MLRVSGRSAVRSGLVWGLVLGGFVASSAWSYVGFYKSEHQRDGLEAAYGSNHALSALFGPFHLQTVTGFTLYKTFVVLLILGGMWGVLTATRLLRGEEEDGHWQLLLCGPTSSRLATGQTLGGMLAGTVGLLAATALVIVAGIVAGVCARLGAQSQHADVSLRSLLGAGLNVIPAALCILWVGALAMGLWPRATKTATYGLLVWSLLIEILAGTGSINHWVLDTSIFHQMTAAPAVAPI